MPDNRINKDDKLSELSKYRDLVLATIDYYLDNKEMHRKTADFDSVAYYNFLKTKTDEHFKKGRLTKLKQWFRDLTEMQVEARNLKFNKYLQEKTSYNIDIFKSYFERVDKVIAKGKITSDNQFYDISIMVDSICQIEPVDNNKVSLLNKLLGDYEQQKSQKKRKPAK